MPASPHFLAPKTPNAAEADASPARPTSSGLIMVLVLAIVAMGLAGIALPFVGQTTGPRSQPISSTITRDGIAPLPTTTTAPTTSTTIAPTTSTTTPQSSTPVAQPAVAAPSGYGCSAALAYLSANANPEFSLVCPGYADGNEAMTCINIAGLCPGQHLIVINDPCAAAYMNEAYNSQSWSDSLNKFTRPIDPYGEC